MNEINNPVAYCPYTHAGESLAERRAFFEAIVANRQANAAPIIGPIASSQLVSN